MRLVVLPGPLQGGDLGFGQHQAVLCALGLECLEPLLHGLQVVALPDTAHPGRGDRQAALLQLIGHPDLAKGRLLDGQPDDRLLDGRLHPIAQDWLAPGHLRQRDLAALFVELLKAVEAVARVSHDLAGLRHIAELFGQLQQTYLGPDYLAFVGHGRLLGSGRPERDIPVLRSRVARTKQTRLSD